MGTIQTTEDERKLVEDANAEFNSWAAFKAGDDMTLMPALRASQINHLQWQAKQFGGPQQLIVMIAGITEEACWELPFAVEQMTAEDGAGGRSEIYDSLGDILIYVCAACTSLRLDFETLSRSFDPGNVQMPGGDAFVGWMNLFKAVGMASHVVGKEAQKTRGYDDWSKVRTDCGVALKRVCDAVHWLSFNNDWDASVLFQDVLSSVMRRNWKDNKLTGEPAVELCHACDLISKGKTIGCLKHETPLYGNGG